MFSELYKPFFETSIIKRACQQEIISYDVDDFFSFVNPKERIDAPICGHGPGMLIKPTVVQKALESKENEHGHAYKIFFSPQGVKLDQNLARTIADKAQETGHLMLIAGRYEGMDARVEQVYADLIVSLGDFVLMGGDIAALAVIESVTRLIPGVVGNKESVDEESFSGPFVEYSHYTEPITWKGLTVPEVIRSGNHAAIAKYRLNESVLKTVRDHFAWLRNHILDEKQKRLVLGALPHHYTALLHNDVLIGDEILLEQHP